MIGVGTVDFRGREKELLNKVLDSGFITAGPVLDEFETRFAERHGCKYGLMLNSGTDALRVALLALKEYYGWKSGEVIVPALTFISTANIVLQCGLTPVLVDVHPATFLIDPARIAEAITNETKAIIPVHLFGLPCDMADILDLAKIHDLKVIEDSCECMGVSYQDKPVGSLGDIGCFSTYAAHIITTGVGGLSTTNNHDLMRLMKSYANHGRNPDFLGFRDSRLLNPGKYTGSMDIVEKRFSFERIGYSARSSQLEAALGIAQLERLDNILTTRKRNADLLRHIFSGIPEIRLQECPDDRGHSNMMFPIVLGSTDLTRIQLCAEMERRGVETRPFFDIAGQDPYKKLGVKESHFPSSYYLSHRGFYVGCHQNLTDSQIYEIGESVVSQFMKQEVEV